MAPIDSDSDVVRAHEVAPNVQAVMVDFSQLDEIFKLRAGIRNNMRFPLIHTLPMSRWHVPEVTPEQIKSEEMLRIVVGVRRGIRERVYGTPQEAYEGEVQNRKDICESDMVNMEEEAKYHVDKIMLEWKCGDLDEAIRLFRHTIARFYNNHNKLFVFRKEAQFEMMSELKRLMEDGQHDEAFEAMLKLAEIKVVTREDLDDFHSCEDDERAFAKVVLGKMGGLLAQNPRLYDAVAQHIGKMKLKGLSKMHESLDIRRVAKSIIVRSLDEGICYFAEAVEVLEDLNLVKRELVMGWPEIKEEIEARLVEYARKSPDAYISLRDEWEKQGVLDAKTMDSFEGVQVVFNEFLKRMYEVHPLLSMMYAEAYKNMGVDINVSYELQQKWNNCIKYDPAMMAMGPFLMQSHPECMEVVEEIKREAVRVVEREEAREKKVFNKNHNRYGFAIGRFLAQYPYFQKCFPRYDAGNFYDPDMQPQ